MKKTAAVSLLAAEFALLTSVRMAAAAETQAEPGKVQLEEIIVVAQRKQQSLLDVPVSATVFDAEALEVAGFDDAKDYLMQTPNVSFLQGGRNGSREIVISIRGISDLKSAEKVLNQSAFSTYIDEFAPGMLASGQFNPNNYDVEGIEILRGPQGVFFGRNSEGGALNVRTRKPTQDFYGRVDTGYGRFNTFELGGVVNGALSENLSGRLTANAEISDGPIKNRHPSGGGSDTEYVHVRGQVRWQPSEATTLDVHVSHTMDHTDIMAKLGSCINQSAFGLPYNLATPELLGGIGCYDANNEFSDRVRSGQLVLPGGLTLADIRDNRDSTYQDLPDSTDNEHSLAIVKLHHELNDSIALTSVTGYSKSGQDQVLDLDRSGIKGINRVGSFDTESYSQELRLSSLGTRKLDWTVGALGYSERLDTMNQILIENVIRFWVPGDKANENTSYNRIKGWGVFGNIQWNITDSLSLIVGGRYSRDSGENVWDNTYAACSRRAPGTPLSTQFVAEGNGPCLLTPEQQLQADTGGLPQYWDAAAGAYRVTGGRYEQIVGRRAKGDSDDFSPRVAINWRPTEASSLYATVSKGYKPGGGQANPDGAGVPSVFDGEQLWNYEIGGNAYLFDRRLLVQGAIFYMDWKDYQFTSRATLCMLPDGSSFVILPGTDTSSCVRQLQRDATENLPKAESKGAEFSATARLTDGLTVNAGLGYLKAEYVEGFGLVGGTRTNLAGIEFGNAPDYTANAGITQAFQWLGGDSAIGLTWSYRDGYSVGATQIATQTFPTAVDPIRLFNLNLSHRWGNNRVTVNVDNLLDEEYFTASETFSFVGPQLTYNPRMWSVRWTSEFK